MHDVFISYGRADEAVARQFAEALEAEGLGVWWDSSLRSGDAYDAVIEDALRQAPVVVVLWSPNSVQSRWVRAEATMGDRNGALVPVMIAPCERPIMFELTHTSDLVGWAGERGDARWGAFLGDVRVVADRRKAAAGADATAAAAVPTAPPPLPLADRTGAIPSLALLPFKNRSHEEDDEVFAIGLVEDVIDALSQAAELRVISSSATARYRHGEIADLGAMARDLGVSYILEGNVRRRGDDLRVTAQLLEASSGLVLWSQKFERPLDELARLEEQLVLEVAANLHSQVNRLEMERALRKPADLTAWEYVTRAVANFRQVTGETLMQALAEATHAVEIAPQYGLAHAMLADAKATIYMWAQPDDAAQVAQIRASIDRALALDPENAMVLAHVAEAYNYVGLPAEALIHANRAIAISPNFGLAHYCAGVAHALAGRSREAVHHFDEEMAAAPGSHTLFASFIWRGSAHVRAGEWDAAGQAYAQATALNHQATSGHFGLFLVHMNAGDEARAAQALADARRYEPGVTLDGWVMRNRRWWTDLAHLDRFIEWTRAMWDRAPVQTAA